MAARKNNKSAQTNDRETSQAVNLRAENRNLIEIAAQLQQRYDRLAAQFEEFKGLTAGVIADLRDEISRKERVICSQTRWINKYKAKAAQLELQLADSEGDYEDVVSGNRSCQIISKAAAMRFLQSNRGSFLSSGRIYEAGDLQHERPLYQVQ